MLIRLNDTLHAQRRRILLTLAATAVALALVSAHSAMAGGDHMDMGGKIAMCVAVAETALLGIAAALSLRPPTVRLRVAPVAGTLGMLTAPAASAHRARAGPAALQVFRE